MKILISLLCILAYIGIGYLINTIVFKDKNIDPISDDVLSVVLIWPIIVLVSIILIIGYYGTVLFVKIYRGIIKR
jgi:hypothetical protein